MTALVLSLVATFALVVSRLAGFVVTSPFPGPWASVQTKIGLVLVVAVAMTPAANPVEGTVGLALAVPATREVVIGLAVGFVLRVAVSSAEVLGSQLAQALGLTFAASYDPAQGAQTDALSRLLSLGVLALALALGAHRVVIGEVLVSFEALPLGRSIDSGALATELLRWVASSFELGVTLSLPVTAVSIAVQLALALVARTASSLNLTATGLPLTLAIGFAIIGMTAPVLVQSMAYELGSAMRSALLGVLSATTTFR